MTHLSYNRHQCNQLLIQVMNITMYTPIRLNVYLAISVLNMNVHHNGVKEQINQIKLASFAQSLNLAFPTYAPARLWLHDSIDYNNKKMIE